MATGVQDHMQFLLPQVPALEVAEDSLNEAWTGFLTVGLFGLLIGSSSALALAAGGWLAGLILGRERRRKREIARVIDRANTSLKMALGAVFTQVSERIHIYLRSLERHVVDRISVFVHDIDNQLQRLGTPIAPEEQRRLEDHERAVRATLTVLAAACSEMDIGNTGGQ